MSQNSKTIPSIIPKFNFVFYQIEDNKALFRQIGKRGGIDSAYYLEPLFGTVDMAGSLDNKRRQMEINTGQLNDSPKNVSGRLPVYQQILAKNLNHNGNTNSNNDDNDMISVNGLDTNDLDTPNDDYRLRYVYSLQQNRYK